MIATGSFTVRSFSNDCIDSTHPENTLSAWTTDLPHEIDFKNEQWVVGVKQVFLGPIATTNFVKTAINDLIVLEARAEPFLSLESLIKYIFSQSLDMDLYDVTYFVSYISKRLSWDFYMLNSPRYRQDYIALDKVTLESRCGIALNPKDLFSQIEISDMIDKGVHDNLKLTTDGAPASADKRLFQCYLPTNVGSLTLLQILHALIRSFIYIYRGSTYTNKDYLDQFEAAWAKKRNLRVDEIVSRAEVLKDFRYHKKMGNTLVYNLVDRFVEKVVQERKLHSSESIELDQHVFIYADLIRPQIVGSMTSRLLTMLPYPGVYRRDVFHHENFTNVEFSPLERGKIKSISLALKNEWGEGIDFVPSRTPNCITLIFKRLEGRE